MNEFLTAAFTMPTTIFSVLLILLALYWLTVLLGVSLYWDMYKVENAPNLGDKTVVLFLAAVQVVSLGLVADLIDKKSRLR